MFPSHKNSYLHSYYKDINSRLINRCVQKAWDFLNIDEHDLDPPFNYLTSHQPCHPQQYIAVTCRPLGFGNVALRKLRRELHHKNPDVVLAAVETITDLVQDSKRAFEAVNLNIINRMADLVINHKAVLREATCRALTVLAGILPGKEAIVSNKILLTNIAKIVTDEDPCVRKQVALMLEMTARFWTAADELLDFGFATIIMTSLLKEYHKIIPIHLQTLHSLMYGSPGKANVILLDGFSTFMELLKIPNSSVKAGALLCLSDITASCQGEKIAETKNLLQVATEFLFYEDDEVNANAALIIMFCTVKTVQQIAAGKLPKLVPRLIEMTKNHLNKRSQMFAIKALTNISHNPDIRKTINKKHIMDITNIPIAGDPDIRQMKKLLMDQLEWLPHGFK